MHCTRTLIAAREWANEQGQSNDNLEREQYSWLNPYDSRGKVSLCRRITVLTFLTFTAPTQAPSRPLQSFGFNGSTGDTN